MKLPFNAIFKERRDGSLALRTSIRCGGVEVNCGAEEVVQSKSGGLYIGGVDFWLFKGHDLQVKTDGDVAVITGIYATTEELER